MMGIKCSFVYYKLFVYAVLFMQYAQGFNEEKSLPEYLFNKSLYDRRIIPSFGLNKPMNITLGLTVYEFKDLVEKKQTLVTSGLFHQSWNDPKLKWDPLDFSGLDFLVVDVRDVWYPDIVSYNSEITNYELKEGILKHNGDIRFSYPMAIRSFCKFDVATYPFDKHRCQIIFGSWGFTGDLLKVEASSTSLDLNSYVTNIAWELESSSVEQNKLYYGGSKLPFYDITFTVTFKRRVLYDSVYLICPGAITALFATTIFLLPVNCSERITTGMAVLVLLSFFFLIVMETLPATSSVSLVSWYYTVTLCQITVSFFLNIVILRYYHMTEDEIPEWVQKYVLNYMGSLLRMQFRDSINGIKDEEKSPAFGIVEGANENPGRKLTLEEFVVDKVIYGKIMQQRKETQRDNEWKKASEIINSYCLIFHLLLVFGTFAATFLRGYSAS